MRNEPSSSDLPSANRPADTRLIDIISELLDSRFRIPGTDFRFGLDPLIGLAPGIGDIISYGMSSALILGMVRKGASLNVVARMLWILFLDTFIGSLPLVGDAFDVWFKANRRNYIIYSKYVQENKEPRPVWPLLLLVFVVIIGILFLLLYLLFVWIPGQIWN